MPDGVKPILLKDKEVIRVIWPVKIDEENPAPGPASYAEVIFDAKTLEIIGALGPQ